MSNARPTKVMYPPVNNASLAGRFEAAAAVAFFGASLLLLSFGASAAARMLQTNTPYVCS